MRTHRENPDSPEMQKAERENQAYIKSLQFEKMKDDPEETSDEQTPANQTATLRDQFAMAALAGLLAGILARNERSGDDELYARDAYWIADAMLKAREEKQP